jgi:hypothetical protein
VQRLLRHHPQQAVTQGSEPPLQRQPEDEEQEEQASRTALQGEETEEEGMLQARLTDARASSGPGGAVGGADSGMPARLRSGLEALSGMDLSGVRVHRDSARPDRLNALAYARGQDIHLGPGQERHLAHEAWHVVQQMQGRVGATGHLRGAAINDDPGLEREADVMGARALQAGPAQPRPQPQGAQGVSPWSHGVSSLQTRGKCKTKFDAAKYVKATVEKGDRNMTDVVDRLMKAKTITVRGQRSVYAGKMQRLNYAKGAFMHVGDCVIMQKDWTDPNIGRLPARKTIGSDLMAKIVATIYAEQTEDVPDQHKYIWHAMRKMIESWEKPAKLVYPGKKKGVLAEFDGFGSTQYFRAKEYLKTGKKPASRYLNAHVVDRIKAMVEKEWTTKIAKDAGMYYFHWTLKNSPTLNKCWNTKENAKKSDADREATCVEAFRKALKWEAKRVKTLRGKGARKKGSPPIGSMYVFESTRTP